MRSVPEFPGGNVVGSALGVVDVVVDIRVAAVGYPMINANTFGRGSTEACAAAEMNVTDRCRGSRAAST
jgi:hypothetical protein